MKEKKPAFTDNNFKILIVDDETDVLNSLRWILESADEFKCDITTASDAVTALAELEQKEFDLIMSDYKMPGMNGIELLTEVKGKYPKMVRILITGFSDIHIAKDAINKADVHTYFEKPWENDELTLTIHEALKRKFARDNSKVNVVGKVKDALLMLAEFKKNLIAIPAEHISKQLIMLEFNSVPEFNKFAFAIQNMENAQIKDVQVYENKHLISIVIRPEKYAFIPKMK